MIVALLLACFAQSYSATTDEDGYARLTLPRGTYIISATAPEGYTAEPREIEVGPDGWAGILILRPHENVWARVMTMSGWPPDQVRYTVFWCPHPKCRNQIGAVVEGMPIPDLTVCPICKNDLPEMHFGIYVGGGADPVEFVIGAEVVVTPAE